MEAAAVRGGEGRCRYAVAPMRRRLTAALAALALLAAPAGALAQSAGDDQYSDPFGDVSEPSQDEGSQDGSSAPPADQVDTPAAESPAAAESQTADPGSGSTLPRTGFPAAMSALLGALLLCAGVSMRRRAEPVAALPPWLVPARSRRGRFGARRRFRR
jgi:hypothetical protein